MSAGELKIAVSIAARRSSRARGDPRWMVPSLALRVCTNPEVLSCRLETSAET